jgi:hypothetical protein
VLAEDKAKKDAILQEEGQEVDGRLHRMLDVLPTRDYFRLCSPFLMNSAADYE